MTAGARQTPPGARPNRGTLEGGPPEFPGRSLDLDGNVEARGMVIVPEAGDCFGKQNPAYGLL